MITYHIKAGTTDVSVVCRAIDSADGTPETAFDHATGGIDLKYRREGAANVDITEAALAALTTAHTDGGVEQIGNGYFRLDLPDAACAAGATGVMVHGVATGMVIIGCYIQLVAYDPFDTVRLGLTALPNAAADAAGGLPISDAGGLDLDAQRADVAATLVDTAEIGVAGAGLTNINLPNQTMDIVGNITGNLSGSVGSVTGAVGSVTAGVTLAASAVQAIWDALTAALTTAGSIGKRLADFITGDAFVRLGAPAGASVSADIAAVKAETAAILVDTAEIGAAGAGLTAINLPDQTMNITGNITGNLSGSVGSVTGAVGSVTAGVTLDATAVDAILDEVVEGTTTMRQALRLFLAALAGKLSGAATTTVTIRNIADDKDRIVATVDADGNRTAVVLDVT